MKTIVINLTDRKDRLEKFTQNNSNLSCERFSAVDGRKISYDKLTSEGYDVNHQWIDPILNTPLTKGEVGCFLSHYHIWEKCIELNEPVLILEDDAILTDRFDMEEIEALPYDFVYLGWKEMDESEEIDGKLVKPVYPYWTLAYMIRPDAARVLVNNVIKRNIIPVDEYLPTKMNEIKVAGYSENVVVPISRNEAGSDVLGINPEDFFVNYSVHVVTVGTDESRMQMLYQSVAQYGGKITNLGKGVKWEGGTMKGQGGGHKINLVKEFIEDKRDTDILIFLDGYDTFITDSIEQIVERFIGFNSEILFSSERICWPDEGLASRLSALNTEFPDAPYQYLNSGQYIGRIGRLKELFAEPIQNFEDDQLYVQKQYLHNPTGIVCDVEGYVLHSHDYSIRRRNGQLYDPNTKCYTCTYHGNGGVSEKEHMKSLYQQFFSSSYLTTRGFEILSDDMILIDFMSKDMCKNMISLAEKEKFYVMEGDKVPAQELRLKRIGLWEDLERHWTSTVRDIVYEYWNPCHLYGLRDAFIIKYEMDKQRELRLHNDASLVTGSVKLNDDYEGGILEFPRQGISNKDVPVGKCLLFPGQVTHAHTSTELQSGTKYSLTIWSSRYNGDTNS